MTVLELRQYSLHPGRRDELVALFEREFVESQEELGARVVGTFHDLADPDRFVWVREFADMGVRLAALRGFYGGPVWKEHRDAANATMIDSDDVLLLEPVGAGFPTASRAGVGEGRPGPSRVLAVLRLGSGGEPDAAAAQRLLGAPVVVARTASYVNDFPALPVRDEKAVVVFAAFPGAKEVAAARRAVEHAWQGEHLQVLELEPTARSAYR
ncbi:NIPSNAP family protein [Pseudonocardia aurantiaca]|uniref:NIPSNAP family protein n=1 Tax=Pseudonocardia aurantiaca TaxID=75290 RepID=A0ABW4FK38_9PSEU